MRRRIVAVVLLAVVAAARAEAPAPYRIVVNARNTTASVDREFVENAFLKKTTTWSGGEAVRPVDLAPGSQVRSRFSEEILERSVAAVKSYWQQMIFSGRGVPPPELDSDDE